MARRFGRQFIAALTLCLLTAVGLTAQQTGTVTGRVTDASSGAPVVAASVEVMSGSRVVGTGLSDQSGNFRIANVPAGAYSLVFTSAGYQTTRLAEVRVLAGETTMAGAVLPSAAFVLNPVVVTSSKREEKALDTPASVSVVGKEEIEQRPAVTPVEHLRNTPGVDIMPTGVQSSNVVVRGFNNIFSGALHTLTDYRIAGVPSLRVNFMHFIPQTNDDIGRIEVVLGPGAALYGPNTANGVLHYLTKSPLDENALGSSISFSGGMHSGGPAQGVLPGVVFDNDPGKNLFHATFRTAHKLSDRFGFKVSGQYLQADEFLYRDRGEDSVKLALPTTDAGLQASALFAPTLSLAERRTRAARIANRDFDIKRWSGDVRADWNAATDLNFVLSGGVTNDNSIELTGIGAGQAVDWRYSYAQVRATYRTWFAQTYLNMSDAGETFLLRNGSPITDKSKVWVSQLQNQTRIGNRQVFTYGADYIATMPETEGTINGLREDDDNYNEYGIVPAKPDRAAPDVRPGAGRSVRHTLRAERCGFFAACGAGLQAGRGPCFPRHLQPRVLNAHVAESVPRH